MPYLKTSLIAIMFVVLLSAVTAYAASIKVKQRSIIESKTAEVAADIIPVGTNAGGTVKEINVHIGQAVLAGTTVATVTSGNGTNETIVATRGGIVNDILVTKNGFIKPQSELIELVDSQNIYVKANITVSPEDLLKLEVNMPVTITIANTTFNGSISTIFPQYDNTTGEATIYCRIEDGPATSRLVPGLPAHVSLFVENPAWTTFSPYLKSLHLL